MTSPVGQVGLFRVLPLYTCGYELVAGKVQSPDNVYFVSRQTIGDQISFRVRCLTLVSVKLNAGRPIDRPAVSLYLLTFT
jgi:hypothetical protein